MEEKCEGISYDCFVKYECFMHGNKKCFCSTLSDEINIWSFKSIVQPHKMDSNKNCCSST